MMTCKSFELRHPRAALFSVLFFRIAPLFTLCIVPTVITVKALSTHSGAYRVVLGLTGGAVVTLYASWMNAYKKGMRWAAALCIGFGGLLMAKHADLIGYAPFHVITAMIATQLCIFITLMSVYIGESISKSVEHGLIACGLGAPFIGALMSLTVDGAFSNAIIISMSLAGGNIFLNKSSHSVGLPLKGIYSFSSDAINAMTSS